MTQDIAVVVGVGARLGIGAAVAVKAAEAGMHVLLAGRTLEKLSALADDINQNTAGQATVVVTDSTEQADIQRLFAKVDELHGELRFVLYNTGRNLPAPFMESTERLIEGHWRRCVLGGMLVGQAAVKRMLEQSQMDTGKGTIIYTGASASLRGKPLFAGFSAAKAGVRMMAQAMAREFGPQGVHVGHIVIDGLVDGAVVRSVGPLGKYLLRQKGDDGALKPDEVAKAFLMLHQQKQSAWMHELDLRPYKEAF